MNDDRFAARVGQTIAGKWQLERLIGVGGMAAVYAARHRVGAPVAIKILHPEVARDSELRQRFEREAMVMGRLEHPGSVEVRDIDVTDDGAPYLVMELLEGESLKERAQRLGGLPSDELLGHVDQALDVLAAAHEQGIVHRDIKPDNLFLTRDGVLKVLDFGIARMREGAPMTMIGTRLGTLPYMPPEQVRAVNVDHRADIFALGAVMFRILAKRRIHEAKTESEMLVKMSAEPAPRLATVAPRIPAAICAIVDRALAFDKDDRYPDARTMQTDVRAVRGGEAPVHAQNGVVGASGPSPLERAGSTALIEPTGHTRAAPGAWSQGSEVEPTGHTRVGAAPPASGTAVATPFLTGASQGTVGFEATARADDLPHSALPSRAGSNDPALGPTEVAPTDPGTDVRDEPYPTLVSGPAPQPTQVMAAPSTEAGYGAGVEVHGAHSMAMPPSATMSVSEPPSRKPVAAIVFAGIAALLVVGALVFALGGDDAPKAASGVEDDGRTERRRSEDDESDDTGSGDASGEEADGAKATATSQPGLPSLIDRFNPPDKPVADKPVADKPIAAKPAPPNPTAALPIEHLPKPQPAQPPAPKSAPPQPTEKDRGKDKSKGKGKKDDDD